MAKPNQNQNEKSQPSIEEVDYAKLLEQLGYDAADLHKVGGLVPIYAAERAYNEKWPIAIGLINRILDIDMGESVRNDDNRVREFVLLQLKMPNKGVLGRKGQQEIVELTPGQDLLIPVSGNLSNIAALRAAAADTRFAYLATFHVTGQKDVGQPSPMWVVDMRIHAKPTPRSGRLLLAGDGHAAPALPQGQYTTTPSGIMHDRDGVIVSATA